MSKIVVKYVQNDENVEASFESAEHAAVLINRLKSHNVPYTVEKSDEPVSE